MPGVQRVLTLVVACAGCAALATSAASGATSKPKYGVFGSPANSRCLSGSATFQTSCKGQVRVYDYIAPATQKVRKGDRRVAFGGFKTGCKALDDYTPSAYDLRPKAGRFSSRATNNYFINGGPVRITWRVTGTFTRATRATVTLRASASAANRAKTKCRASAFRAKTRSVRWFAAKNTGG